MTVLVEIFKEIEGFEEYLISNIGTVISSKNNKKIIMKQCLDSEGYYRISLNKNKKRHIKKIHKLVASAFLENHENKTQVDHIDNDRTNNNISNLRWASSNENQHNRKKEIKRITSSIFKGVSFDNSRNKWLAQIRLNRKTIHIGRFNIAVDAAKAYDARAKELFGEFAKTNF